MHPLPESVLPELRAKWLRYLGARETLLAAQEAVRRIEADYQSSINLTLRTMDVDAGKNWKVDLDAGQISEVTATDVANYTNGMSVPADPSIQAR